MAGWHVVVVLVFFRGGCWGSGDEVTSGKRKNAEFILIHLKWVFKMN
jgi:hypothetical protein